jgi:glyoxylase-like metal-dependent hydrolase (beta-lactamase superfamily II)
MPEIIPFDTPHFALQRLADGVLAAIAKPNGLAYCNGGLVNLGGRVVAVDAFDHPVAAADLRRAALSLFDRDVGVVFLTHPHGDHWSGVQSFLPGATILATHAARQAILAQIPEMLAMQADPSREVERLKDLEKRLETETDPAWRTWTALQANRLRQMLASLPEFNPVPPDQTFEGSLAFHGADRTAEIRSTGHGHSQGDAVLFLPVEKIAFIGDLGFFASQPFTGMGNFPAWKRQLQALIDSEYEIFVPGHGPVGGKADLALQIGYMDLLQELVAEVVRTGGTVDAALQILFPAPYDAWVKANPWRFERNVRSLFQFFLD